MIVGLDDVGTGSLCYHLMIGAVRAESSWSIPSLKDSKKLSFQQREEIYEELKEQTRLGNILPTLSYSTAQQIDEKGLGNCMRDCMMTAINTISQPDDEIIIDGNWRWADSRIKSVVQADSKYPTVMAAAILAKVTRDRQIIELDKQFPDYKWSENKGYGSSFHKEAIKKFGLTEHHRKSFKLKGV